MSKDKYLSIFLKPNGGYCVYYPSDIFRNAHAYSPVFSQVMRLDQSRDSENI